jgi:hypothetical protein
MARPYQIRRFFALPGRYHRAACRESFCDQADYQRSSIRNQVFFADLP